MGSIAIAGDTSGSITITVPAVAGNNTLILPATSATIDIFPVGTAMMFVQTTAPTGWTKSVANDNAALRIVSGSASTGGSVNFSTAFASQAVAGTVGTSGSTTATGTVGATTLTSTQIPSHSHTFSGNTGTVSADHTHTYRTQTPVGAPSGGPVGEVGVTTGTTSGISANHTHAYSGTTSNTGSGSSHDHTFTGAAHTHTGGAFTGTAINLAVKYVDAIIATKN